MFPWRRLAQDIDAQDLYAESGHLVVWGSAQAAFDQSIADSEAMDRCKKAAAGDGSCAIVAKTPGAK